MVSLLNNNLEFEHFLGRSPDRPSAHDSTKLVDRASPCLEPGRIYFRKHIKIRKHPEKSQHLSFLLSQKMFSFLLSQKNFFFPLFCRFFLFSFFFSPFFKIIKKLNRENRFKCLGTSIDFQEL